jgi:hypothetical protein
MDFYEEITDEQMLSTALNTYQFIVLGRDYEDIIDENSGDSYFFIDVTNRIVLDDVLDALNQCLDVLEINEHYEKCADICVLLEKMDYNGI